MLRLPNNNRHSCEFVPSPVGDANRQGIQIRTPVFPRCVAEQAGKFAGHQAGMRFCAFCINAENAVMIQIYFADARDVKVVIAHHFLAPS
jgi:hypothetical protein